MSDLPPRPIETAPDMPPLWSPEPAASTAPRPQNTGQDPETAPLPSASHPRRDPRRAWARIAALLAVLIFALHMALPHPTGSIALPVWTALPLAVIAGCAISLPIAVFWVNRARWRMILRPKGWRVGATLLMAGFTPIMFWGWLPSVVGFWTALGLISTLQSAFIGVDLLMTFLLVAPVILAYPLACALIYGLERRRRLPAFVMFNVGQMAFVAAMGLVYPPTLY